MLDGLYKSSRRVGLCMNLDKTKVMFTKQVIPRPTPNCSGLCLPRLYMLGYITLNWRGFLVDTHEKVTIRVRYKNNKHLKGGKLSSFIETAA